MRDMKYVSKVAGKPLANWSSGRPKKLDDNIKMRLTDVVCGQGR
jgi:hypothetical protein